MIRIHPSLPLSLHYLLFVASSALSDVLTSFCTESFVVPDGRRLREL
jgi:hypothetical protein